MLYVPVQRAERDKELTFQPRLATAKYWEASARRRGRAASRGARGRADGVSAPGPARGASLGGGEGWGRGAAEAAAGTRTGRFEMLYQDVRCIIEEGREGALAGFRKIDGCSYGLPDVPRLPRYSVLALSSNYYCTPADPEASFSQPT